MDSSEKARPKDAFFAALDQRRLAVTFEEVLVLPGCAVACDRPEDVDVTTSFSTNIPLAIPFSSAAMDTVTGPPMAIAIALLGGIGVLHRNCSAEEQADAVSLVKRHLGALNPKPSTVKVSETMASIRERIQTNKIQYESFPVLDAKGCVVGVITGRDFKFCTDFSKTAAQILERKKEPLISVQRGISRDEAMLLMEEHQIGILPIVTKGNRLWAIYVWKDIRDIVENKYPLMTLDAKGRLRVAAAVGIGDRAVKRAQQLVEREVDALVLEMAHSDSDAVYETFKILRKEHPRVDIMVGNVAKGDSAKRLADLGVNGIRIGEGGGSICTTRVVTGTGCPQLTAVHRCELATRGYGIPLCSDGGIVYSGDVTKALAGGGDTVMFGKVLAGTEETPGETTLRGGQLVKLYRGMGSLEVLKESTTDARDRYALGDNSLLVPEGIVSEVPYKGPMKEVIDMFLGGLRKGMFNCGARSVAHLHEIADFDQCGAGGMRESHPHDVTIVKEAPNYPVFRREEQ